MSITNVYIDSILYKFCKNYLGCFSSNILPSEKVKNCSLICNLSKDKEPGTHFVCIIITKSEVYYIDSLGLPPYIDGIIFFLKKQSKVIRYLHNQLQPKNSPTCGFYVIMFVLASENKNVSN